MSTTQERDREFQQQVTALLKCFKYLELYEKTQIDSTGFFIKQLNRRVTIQRKTNITPDNKSDVIIKNKLQLVPAVLDLAFTTDSAKDFKSALFSCPFDSDVLNNVEARISGVDLDDTMGVWYQNKERGQQTYDLLNADQKVARTSLQQLRWKAYHSKNEHEDIIYVHFPGNDSWLAVYFASLSSDSDAIQILDKHNGFIVDTHDLKYDRYAETFSSEYSISSTTYSIEPSLDKDSFFDLSEMACALDFVADAFKEDQDDPYIDADLLDSEALNFLSGSEDELERLLILICHAAIPMQHWDELEPFEILADSAMNDGESASINYDSMSYDTWAHVKDRLGDKLVFVERAFDAALDQNQPCGHTWEYNDGPYDRRSGYDCSPCRLSFQIPAPSAHEQICAKIEIKKLAHILSKDTIDGLLK